MLPGLGCEDAGEGPNSMVTHGGTSTSRGRRRGFAGRMLVVLGVRSSSLPWSSSRRVVVALCPALSQSHTHARTQGGRRRKTNAASDACEEGRQERTGYAGGPAAVHERDGNPLRRSNHGDSSFSNYSNGPVGAARLTPSRQARSTLSIPLLCLLKPRCLPVGQQQRRHSTGERRWASSLRPG